jgi:hypothetical protein
VGRPRNDFQLRVLDDLDRQATRIVYRHDLICVTLNRKQRHLRVILAVSRFWVEEQKQPWVS